MSELAQLVGRRIQLLRKLRGLSQEALAAEIGVATETISNIERARHGPSLETLETLLEALRVTPSVFFQDDFPGESI